MWEGSVCKLWDHKVCIGGVVSCHDMSNLPVPGMYVDCVWTTWWDCCLEAGADSMKKRRPFSAALPILRMSQLLT